jgi:hypothetical protein
MLACDTARWSPIAKKYRQEFRQEEDAILIHLVGAFGVHNWKHIAMHMINRTPRQCRDRWQCYLSPSVNRTPWTPEEDRLLLSKYREIGGKWSMLCPFFRNRSLNNVKNRWNTIIRKVRAFGMDETSDHDWLRCAGLINHAPENTEDPASPSDNPTLVFQIARLLNSPA